jgi:hypothetical protein
MAGDEPGAGRFLEFAGGIREVLGFRWVDTGDCRTNSRAACSLEVAKARG